MEEEAAASKAEPAPQISPLETEHGDGSDSPPARSTPGAPFPSPGPLSAGPEA